MPFSKVFVNTYIKCRELGIWSLANDAAHTRQIEIPGVGMLSSKILRIFSIGTERAIAYYKKFYIESRDQNSRPEDEVSLKLISGTALARIGDLANELIIKTCTSAVELLKERKLTVKILKQELVYLRDMYDEIPSDSDLNKLDRPRLVFLLSQWRAHYYMDFPNMVEFHKDLLNAQFEAGSESTAEERETELACKFLSLSQATKDDPRFSS